MQQAPATDAELAEAGVWGMEFDMRDTVRMVSKSKISVNTEWNIVPSTGTASWELEHSIQRKPSRT